MKAYYFIKNDTSRSQISTHNKNSGWSSRRDFCCCEHIKNIFCIRCVKFIRSRPNLDVGSNMRTIRLSDEIHVELTKIVGELIARKGKRITYDEAIMELITFWREHH